jgi:hypothetical protein
MGRKEDRNIRKKQIDRKKVIVFAFINIFEKAT